MRVNLGWLYSDYVLTTVSILLKANFEPSVLNNSRQTVTVGTEYYYRNIADPFVVSRCPIGALLVVTLSPETAFASPPERSVTKHCHSGSYDTILGIIGCWLDCYSKVLRSASGISCGLSNMRCLIVTGGFLFSLQ